MTMRISLRMCKLAAGSKAHPCARVVSNLKNLPVLRDDPLDAKDFRPVFQGFEIPRRRESVGVFHGSLSRRLPSIIVDAWFQKR